MHNYSGFPIIANNLKISSANSAKALIETFYFTNKILQSHELVYYSVASFKKLIETRGTSLRMQTSFYFYF